jgi:hypothetical protein
MEMACELRLKDNGLLLGLVVWQVLYKVFLGQGLYKLQIMGRVKSEKGSSGPSLHSFKCTSGQHLNETLRGEVRDVDKISWCNGEHFPHKEGV